MLRMGRLGLLALVLGLGSTAAQAQTLTLAERHSVPDWVETAVARAGAGRPALDARLNPFCLRGDFDGDGRTDFAVLVADLVSGKKGVAVVHRRDAQVFVVGAGRSLSSGRMW